MAFKSNLVPNPTAKDLPTLSLPVEVTWMVTHGTSLSRASAAFARAPKHRPSPAGAFVDGTTWAAISAAGIEPMAALERCDAGTALAAVGALVVTGATGINHADLVILG